MAESCHLSYRGKAEALHPDAGWGVPSCYNKSLCVWLSTPFQICKAKEVEIKISLLLQLCGSW